MTEGQKSTICCTCAPAGPFCGACAYDEDGELIEVRAHEPALRLPGVPLDSGFTYKPGYPRMSLEAEQRVLDKMDSVNEARRVAMEDSHHVIG